MSDISVTEFFAPAVTGLLDGLIADYKRQRAYIDRIADIVAGELGGCFRYFVDGNHRDHSRFAPSVEELFDRKGAIAALNSDFWQRALAMTDVYDFMPQARRDEWNKQIREMKCVEFTEESVKPTIESLLAMRAQFMAERVDGIFRNLSGLHVTNSPMAFGKRMIISYMTNYYGDKTGYINDLRCIIAKFMGRDTPKWNATAGLVKALQSRTGEWHIVDGGALRIRLYKKGTAHLEVHPDMAWRLNAILASIYPNAIPFEARQKPKARVKSFAVMERPLPFAVLDIIGSGYFKQDSHTFRFDSYAADKGMAYQEAIRVLLSIGGVQTGYGSFEFDYYAKTVIDSIISMGCIPDQKSHQYYPTPETIAKIAVDMACIGPTDTVLEPSAGQGGLADFLPKERTTCVEISELHYKILAAKGFNTVWHDFLDWWTPLRFDRIVMNPPFSDGRWRTHLDTAYDLLKPGGRIVAVLPASAKNRVILPAKGISWSNVYSNEFSGTGVSVVVMCLVK